MNRIYRFLIRVSAFLGKEIYSILRQPMLVFTLVLGPFLILLLFGLGFRNDPPVLRTLFVLPEEENNMAEQLKGYVTSLGPQLLFMGITNDKAGAIDKLIKRQVDVVAVIPPNAAESIRNSQQVTIELDHYEIDPFQIQYINIFGQVYADEINRRILREITVKGQKETTPIQDSLANTRQALTDMDQALQVGDQLEARQNKQKLAGEVDSLALVVGASLGLADGVQQVVTKDDPNSGSRDALSLLSTLREDVNDLDVDNTSDDSGAEKEKIDKMETELSQLETMLSEFQSIDANVLISPFRSEAKSISAVEIQPSDFFAPAVIALLLQHLALTFAALSIVQESQSGTMELFRVSPISALETLLGKYLSYLLFSAILAAILTILVVYGLGVPLLGDWLLYSFTTLALLFTSLGLGFIISLVAKTDTEAVQYSMIVLLASVFFSGAFINLQALWAPIRMVS
jgi:ABC-2 type transport system permease protein